MAPSGWRIRPWGPAAIPARRGTVAAAEIWPAKPASTTSAAISTELVVVVEAAVPACSTAPRTMGRLTRPTRMSEASTTAAAIPAAAIPAVATRSAGSARRRRNKKAAPNGRPFRFRAGGEQSDHHDLGSDPDPVVEIDDVLVAHADAARGNRGADRPGLVRAVDAVEGRAEIHGARAERIFRVAL